MVYFGHVVPVLARWGALPSAAAEVVYALAHSGRGRLLRDNVVDMDVAHGAMLYVDTFVCALVRRQLRGACRLRLL
jgi:hypothetical protein